MNGLFSHIAFLDRTAGLLPGGDAAPPESRHGEGLISDFHVGRHRLRLRVWYWRRPDARSLLVQQWRRVSGEVPFFHVQQTGRRPAFLGVACADAALGRHFTLELLCGGWGWHTLRREHVLLIVQDTEVRAFVGRSCRPARALAELATGQVLPRAREQVAREQREQQEQAAVRAILAADSWLAARGRATGFLGREPTVAAAEAGGKIALVTGAIAPEEARALARSVAEDALWRPDQHGHVHVHVDTPRVEVGLQSGEQRAATRIALFVQRFCRHVIISDLHLGQPSRDTFGSGKADTLARLLRRVIRDRSTLVLNGDFLELLHERYGAIRRAYSEIFALLRQVRRVLYIAGNHDDDILRENIKLTRRAARKEAVRHAYARVELVGEQDLTLIPVRGAPGVRRAAEWTRFLTDAGLRATLEDITRRRHGTIWLSRGFAREGVAFQRLGPRDTDTERPQWYLDESLLDHSDRVNHLLKLLADRRQRLDKVLRSDWGSQVHIQRYHWDPAGGLYCEHGHFAIPACHGHRLGRAVSVAAGWTKRLGLRQIEHWFEEHLAGWLRAIHPFDALREFGHFAERQLAVATALVRLGGAARRPLLVCSHTHEPAAVGEGPIHAVVQQATGATYANTGAWSSRSRLKRAGDRQVEWLEISATGRATVRTAEAAVSPATPSSARVNQLLFPALVGWAMAMWRRSSGGASPQGGG